MQPEQTRANSDGRESLAVDERGAVLVLGLFMGVLLVSLLYYLIGIGDTLIFKEKLQDAADASAYSAGIVHARGMNILVMLNVIMAAVLAVLVVLKLISTVCTAAIAICIGLAFWTAGASMAPVPTLESGREIADNAYSSLKEPVFALLEGGNALAHVVREVTPLVAWVEVEYMAANVYSPPSEMGVMFPLYQSLPTEDDEFSRLCEKAGEFAGELAALPLSVILRWGWLSSALGGLVGGLAKTFSSYFCGDGGTNAPGLTYEEPIDLPRLRTAEAQRCDAEKNKPASEQNSSVLNGDCQVAGRQAEQAARAIDRHSGDCEGSGADLCEQRRRDARSVCRPGATEGLERWWWQAKVMRRRYRLVEAQGQRPRVVVVGEDVVVRSSFEGGQDGGRRPPCWHNGINSGWTRWDSDPSRPLCLIPPREPHPIRDLKNQGKTETTVDYPVVSDILSCQASVERTLTMDDTLGETDGDGKSPQKVKECAYLGEPVFQLRVGVKGDGARLDRFERGVSLARWGREGEAGTGLESWLRRFAQIAVAQSEYYWDGSGSPGDDGGYSEWRDLWMWEMAWKARIRRVRLSSGEDDCSETEDGGGASGPFETLIEELEGVVLH